MPILSYEFCELPLVIDGGIPAAFINGIAEIKFNRDCQWSIESIAVEVYLPLTAAERAVGKNRWIYLKAPAELAHMIGARLEGEWYIKICDAVQEQLASDHEAVLDDRADARRDRAR